MGLFPSYFEGFPFGVLEMLAAGLPVAAYDAPGAPMMVPAEWLAPRGDAHALAARLAWMLRDANQLRALQLSAPGRSLDDSNGMTLRGDGGRLPPASGECADQSL